MKNKLLHYIKEVVMPREYRDTQVAKIINSSKPDDVMQNFYIDNIIFFKGFLDKILNHLMTFPDELDKKNDVYTMHEPSVQENPNVLDDEYEDDNEYEDDLDNIIFSFKSKEKQDHYRNKIFYFKPNLYSSNFINIENDFFDFYLSSFLSDENILLQDNVGYSLKISVKLSDKSPKIIDLRKITEKIANSGNYISIFINYSTVNRRDFTIISDCVVSETGIRNSNERMKHNNFIIIDEINFQRSLGTFYTYYVRDKEKTINLDRHAKIKKHYAYNTSIQLDFSDYLYDFHMKYGEMFSKITSKEEKEKTFENFIKTHVKPLTINMSNLQSKISTLTFFLYRSKNYYGDYKIISRLMEKYLDMCQGPVLTTIIDPNMESRLEK